MAGHEGSGRLGRWANLYLPPLLYGGFIFHLSSRSFSSVHLFGGLDKGAHFLLYAGFGYTLVRAFHKAGRLRPAFWAVLAAVLYGVTDECHQWFVPGREFELLDILFDGLGAATAAWLCGLAERAGRPIWF